MTTFDHSARVRPEWIDYNGHMQDAYYGLVFSHAVDAFQDAVGFDAAYRAATGCTIYLLENHTRFLREVRPGAALSLRTHLIAFNARRFHLWSEMRVADAPVAISEMIEMHVRQHPEPHAADIPPDIAARLAAACLDAAAIAALACRARLLSI
ncbi:thioesterase family protein [Maritimibacter fusiformis]|uniref:Thioesterase n=1 Tax=Maritimibacter fusiformis TaxID=2603819 RepID=A0A5D0RFS2_9RHOB|nr:thioesterase family protein [Maritimibacter fusiformis]TYB80437.1 thioesterase [Maritimibacter fusiformis]